MQFLLGERECGEIENASRLGRDELLLTGGASPLARTRKTGRMVMHLLAREAAARLYTFESCVFRRDNVA